MIQILQQALTILTTPPGNLAYHLIVAFLLVIVLQAALVPWRVRGLPQGRRMTIGLFFLLLGRLLLFASALIAGQDLAIPDVLFPILDRAVTAFSLLIIVWLWAFPDRLPSADAAALLVALLTLTLSIFTFIWWSNQGLDAFFNATVPGTIWEVFSLVLLLLGGLALLARRPIGWGVAVVMFVLLAAGHLVHLLAPLPDNDYPGAVRLAQLIAYPLLFFLPQRFTLTEPAAARPPQQHLVPDRRRYSLGPEAFQAFLSLATGTGPQEICRSIARTVSEALLADICLLVASPDESGAMAIECGYDLIREEYRDGGYLSSQDVPLLATALQRGRALRLPANSSSEDLSGLSQTLNLSRTGPMLAVPVFSPGDEIILGLVLLSPYSNRTWTPEDQNYLLGISKSLGDVVLGAHRGAQAAPSGEGDQEYGPRPEQAQEVESLPDRDLRQREPAEALAQAIASQEHLQETIAELQAENQRLRQDLEAAGAGPEAWPAEGQQLQGELRLALEEVARLRNELAQAEERITRLQAATPERPPAGESDEVVLSIAQELRQPMSSIVGYTDLLLSESAGILGALQRKFLERIKISTERLGALVEDLVQVTSLDAGAADLSPESVDLHQVIQESVEQTRAQVQAKDLRFDLDLPDALPALHADRDAIQQALLHLLHNAVSATPDEGQVSLRVRVESAHDKQDYVLIQVADQGGGIPSEDLPRVFSRLYRADNVLIQGVGDTGVGLSIVKQTIEAHGGRIWVDTEPGHGSIFSLLLPLDEAPVQPMPALGGTGNSP